MSEQHEFWMQQALMLADEAEKINEIPVVFPISLILSTLLAVSGLLELQVCKSMHSLFRGSPLAIVNLVHICDVLLLAVTSTNRRVSAPILTLVIAASLQTET